MSRSDLEEAATVSGRIRKVIFQRDGFLAAALDDGTKVAGEMHAQPDMGRTYVFTGEWVVHPRFGRQLKFKSYDAEVPRGREAIGAYLRDTCSYLGSVRVARILEVFGEEALDVLKSDPGRVAREVRGLTVDQAAVIAKELAARAAEEALDIGLRTLFEGVKIRKAVRAMAVALWGREACEVIKGNPFLLTQFHGVGFLTADQVARRVGFPPDAPERMRAAMLHVLNEAKDEGHCYLPVAEMISEAAALTSLLGEKIYREVPGALRDGQMTIEGEYAYLPEIHAAELFVARNLAERSNAEAVACVAKIEGLAEDQVRATEIILGSHMALLTGPPGTGKTYTLKRVIDAFAGRSVAICAPTGKAARRIRELTGWNAQTIHKLLEPKPLGDGFVFTRDAGNPIDQSVVVVDEVSMVPITLMASLLRAMRRETRLILTGDADQLPSVGPGAVLRDLMASKVVAHAQLHEIKRQAAGSRIIHACHAVRLGHAPTIGNGKEDDLFFVQESDAARLAAMVVDLVYNRLPARYALDPRDRRLVAAGEGEPLDPFMDIQVITGHRDKTPLSAKALNSAMQAARMERSGQARDDKQRFYVGDKVMQTVNTMASDSIGGEVFVANGDIGLVRSAEEGKIVVEFDSPTRVVAFPAVGNDLDLAYAVTVHKFQGSQAPCVVIPVHRSTSPRLLQRSWVYTAMSRAEKLCVFAGQRPALEAAVYRAEQDNRRTRLCELLREAALGVT